jgi:cell division protein FtsI/penicillin-binding protein 2
VEQQEEVAGSLRSEKQMGEIELATNSFGQGIAITPIQMISAFNTIANGGIRLSPSLIEGGKTNIAKVLERVAVDKTTSILVSAIDKNGVKWGKPVNISVAGKTGTAQVPIEGHYDADKTIASFIGFFPSSNPKYTMLVTLEQPQTSRWGSETAAPLWFELLKQISL